MPIARSRPLATMMSSVSPMIVTTIVMMIVAMVVAAPMAAQSSESPADAWTLPRTVWGHPDLQGNWTNQSRTPTERRRGYGPTLTQAQVDSILRSLEERIEEGVAASDPDRPPPEAGGGVGGYNEIYYDRGAGIAIVNGEARSSLITFPADGRIPALTASGQRRLQAYHDVRLSFAEADHPEVLTQADRCLVSYGSTMGPPMLPSGGYNSNYTVVQGRDHVVILTEMVHDVRIIPLEQTGETSRADLPSHVRPWFGISSGRWEGNTLIVETTNLNPRQMFSPTFDPEFTTSVLLSDDARIVERFTRVDEHTLLYEFEVDDPGTWVERWGGQIPMRRFDDLVYEYACHEGNYAIEGILSGARYQEGLAADRP